MNRFIKKNFFFILPLLTWILIEGFLPSNTFTYRPWESLKFNSRLGMGKFFYPNSKIQMLSVGDLCHHTKNSAIKKENWITDKIGFRNDTFIKKPDILIIGDSFTTGSGLCQDNTLTKQIQINSNENLSVYNMSPASISVFLYYLDNGIIDKPKWLIYSIVERHVPETLIYSKPAFKSKLKIVISNILDVKNISVYIDKCLRLYSVNWLQARKDKIVGHGVPGLNNMYFLYGRKPVNNNNKLTKTVNIIQTYKKLCDSLNIKFLFLPMPNKETVYFDMVPLCKQPQYLFKLDSLLQQKGVLTLNTLNIYNEYRKNNTNFLYQLDDTHWNSIGTHLISKEILKKINLSKDTKI